MIEVIRGHRIGSLTIDVPHSLNPGFRWVCCDCGVYTTVPEEALRNGTIQHCPYCKGGKKKEDE